MELYNDVTSKFQPAITVNLLMDFILPIVSKV
jgi:hypothetical protein